MNPSWVPIKPTNLRLPPSGGRTGARPLIKCALTSERPTLGANFKNPQSGKPDAAVGPDRVSPARWSPKPPLGARVRGTWAERVAGKVCEPRRAVRGPGWRRGRWPPRKRRAAGGTSPLPAPRGRPPASGTWKVGGISDGQHPVRWEGHPASRSGRKSRRRSRASAPGQYRIRFGPDATLWTWSVKRRPRDLHPSLGPHLPPPGHPTEESRRLGPEVAKSKWEGVPGAPPNPGSS